MIFKYFCEEYEVGILREYFAIQWDTERVVYRGVRIYRYAWRSERYRMNIYLKRKLLYDTLQKFRNQSENKRISSSYIKGCFQINLVHSFSYIKNLIAFILDWREELSLSTLNHARFQIRLLLALSTKVWTHDKRK